MKHTIKLLLLATVVVCFAACGTSRKATKGSGTENSGKAEATAEAYKEKVVSNFQTAQYLTARATISLKAGTKDISVGGSLKMKRNDVIQLSLTFLGIEVGRMEFTTTDVLIIDKINKQYVRAPYSQASVLESAGLDFYSLQSLFWNEIFSPGTHDVGSALKNFSVASSGDHTLLSLTSAPKLCKYSDFAKFDGKKFPRRINISFNGGKRELGLDMQLSGLSTNSSWETRTKVSSSYKQRSVDDILGKLSMLQ